MKKRIPLLLIGGGGHCKACIDVIESTELYEIVGIVDKQEKLKSSLLGYKYIGTDENLSQLIKKYKNVHITLGQIKSCSRKKEIIELAKSYGAIFPKIISKYAVVSAHTSIGQGSIIMHQVVIQADAKVGDFCIINNKALLEHDCVVGNVNHISTGAILNGGVSIGNESFIGSQSCILQNVKIGSNVIIGAGTTIKEKVLDGVLVK